MNPYFSPNNAPDSCAAYAVLLAKFIVRSFAGLMAGANFNNLPWRELRLATPAASFRNHIGTVIGLRTQKEMMRIATRWIVARMAYVFIVWNWAKMNLIRNAMGAFPAVATTASAQRSVARVIASPLPQPAFVNRPWSHMSPEAVYKRNPGFSLAAHAMPLNKASGHTPDPTVLGAGLFCKRRGQTTAAFAEFDSRLFSGILRIHRKVHTFLVAGRGHLDNAARCFYWVLPSYYTTIYSCGRMGAR